MLARIISGNRALWQERVCLDYSPAFAVLSALPTGVVCRRKGSTLHDLWCGVAGARWVPGLKGCFFGLTLGSYSI